MKTENYSLVYNYVDLKIVYALSVKHRLLLLEQTFVILMFKETRNILHLVCITPKGENKMSFSKFEILLI